MYNGITSYFIKANTQPAHFINGRIFKARAKRSTAGISTGPHKQIKCTYCKKVGGVRGMKRYHLENCKYKKELV